MSYALPKSWIAPLKAIVFALSLVPLARIIYAILFDPISLGANPAETILHMSGDWVIYFLLITLAITPLRKLTGWNDLIKFRRMMGLYAFFYACVHFLSYIGFDRLFDLSDMAREIVKRPFILVGFAAFVLLVPLAVTSTRGWVLRLGGARWSALHKAVYPIAILGIVHYWWLVKRDITWPVLFALVLAVLLAYRGFKRGGRKIRAAS
ncbi:MAG: sulfoxide reductase heme-binding subunit YedZ [Alphaproteobacteria bacterium]|jgi:sulfoxide reductase heme-binding subunit YedZ|nr:sulfoxide reductase heme-binding subunit YedZ [Alphaproteobacteria bacterium]